MKLSSLLSEVETLAVAGNAHCEVAGVASDSRQVRPGFVFVAVPGAALDGRAYADDAVARGAVAVVAQGEPAGRGAPCSVSVADARRAVAQLAAAFHGQPARRLQMVGITGTNGKTTTAYMVRECLRRAGRAPGLITTVEYVVGARAIPAARTTPDPVMLQSLLAQMVAAGCRAAVMEVSSHSLVQQRVAGIDYDVGVFTNLTRDHLDYHHTLEEYFRAKALLFTGLGAGARPAAAVLNWDDPWGRRLAQMPELRAERLTYGTGAGAVVQAEGIALSGAGSRFTARTPWGSVPVRLALLGRHNISNALAALAAGGALGLAPEALAEALAGVSLVPGRLEEIPHRHGFQVFVDYAHTDDALEHALATLRELTAGRLIAVFGCGGNRDTTKRPAMGAAAARLADYSVLTSDNPRKEDPAAILAQIRAGFGAATNFEVEPDRAKAIERALALARKGDVVLIAGKGHETFQEFANTTIPFDDRQVARKALGAEDGDGR